MISASPGEDAEVWKCRKTFRLNPVETRVVHGRDHHLARCRGKFHRRRIVRNENALHKRELRRNDLDHSVRSLKLAHRQGGLALQQAKKIDAEPADHPAPGHALSAKLRNYLLHDTRRNRLKRPSAEVDVARHVSALGVELDCASADDHERKTPALEHRRDKAGKLERALKQICGGLNLGHRGLYVDFHA